MPKAVDILDEARSSFLNDSSGATYTDAILIPKLKTAYSLLLTELIENKVQITNMEATKTITAGDILYSPLPNDLVIPVSMQERKAGTTDEWIPMYEERNLTNVAQSTRLIYWSWRLDQIHFKGATENVEVKLIYQRSFPSLNVPSQEVFGKAEQFLSAKVAALVYMFVEQSPTLAAESNAIARAELASVVNIAVKRMQAMPIRRKQYIPGRPR